MSYLNQIFEYAILSRLEGFFEAKNILSHCQFGFRRGCSTSSAIQYFYNKLIAHLEDGQCPAGIFCDLSRAFDCVNVPLLMEKLELYGVRGTAFSWLFSFLSEREQYVSLASQNQGVCNSSTLAVEVGVPQGSVLGPFLFITYINDLIQSIDPNWTVALFADDSSFVVSTKNDEMEGVCNAGLAVLFNWFGNNFLHLNISKTTYMRFHTAQYQGNLDISIKVGDSSISRSATTKFLGLILDENLNWKKQCEVLSARLSSLCFMMRNLKTVLSQAQLLNVYNAYVSSRLHYGICFWGASSASKIIFTTQKRVVRCMLGMKPTDSCRGTFKFLGIPSLTGVLSMRFANMFLRTNPSLLVILMSMTILHAKEMNFDQLSVD